MEIYIESDRIGLELVENTPFSSEAELEDFLFSNKNLMGDLYAFARQAKSGNKRNIADILAVDDNGMVYVVEVKNVRPRGEDVLMQALRYVDWIKRNPSEIKFLWQEWKRDQPEDSVLPEPDWNEIQVGVLIVAPSFDSGFVRIILNSLKIPFRFLAVEKYIIGEKTIIITNQLDQLEQNIAEKSGIPAAKGGYSWDTYLETTTDKVGLVKAKQLHDETLNMLKEIDLDWLQVRFNKHYIAYKNGGRNVIELYFDEEGLPGLAFHMAEKPSKLGIKLPEGIIGKSAWSSEYKVVYVPATQLGVSVETLKPLFLEAKKYRT